MTEWTDGRARGPKVSSLFSPVKAIMGGGVTGTVDPNSVLLTSGPRPGASPSASRPWAVIHRICQEQGLAEWQAPRSPNPGDTSLPLQRGASTNQRDLSVKE